MYSAERLARRVTVAVVDDFGHTTIPRGNSGGVGSDPDQRAGHGEACAQIVGRLAPDADVIRVGVDGGPDASGDDLARALEAAISTASVVSVSLGTTWPSPRLDAVCAAARDTVIVAAEHNEGLVSYPAHLPSVIGVRGGAIRGDDSYEYHPGQPIECVARGDAQRLRWSGGREVFIGGSSFAAPRIAGIVARLKAAQPEADLEDIRERLRQGATRVIETPRAVTVAAMQTGTKHAPAGIRRATLYPFTKEMHALVRFPDLLPFDVVGVADPPGRGHAGRDAGQAIGAAPANLTVAPTVRAACDGADTLILGYVRQLGRLRGRDVHREQLALALDLGLHVFSFEPVPQSRYPDLHRRARDSGLRIEWPAVTAADLARVRQAAPGPVDVPVLGVFGTSAAQGKFTLQLALRRRLLQLGYRVGQVGTEHHAGLFGVDAVFPMGHGSTVEIGVEDYPEFIDRTMCQIRAARRPDLFLVGSQSGTVPYDVHDPRTLTLPTLAFLLGAKPDACILVVNAIDPDDYVADTIAALRGIAQVEVVGLAVSDKARSLQQGLGRSWVTAHAAAADELSATRRRLHGRFELPVEQITSDAGVARLCEAAIAHFAAAPENAAPKEARETAPCQRKTAS